MSPGASRTTCRSLGRYVVPLQEHRFAAEYMEKRANLAMEHSLVVRKQTMRPGDAVRAVLDEYKQRLVRGWRWGPIMRVCTFASCVELPVMEVRTRKRPPSLLSPCVMLS